MSLQSGATTSLSKLEFKRSTGPKKLSLFFTVAGCDLRRATPPPRLIVTPLSSAQLPGNAVSYPKNKPPVAKGSTLIVQVEVDGKKFDPGTYESLLVLQAPYLAFNKTPVTVTRSEDNVAIPILIAAIGAALGVAWALLGAALNIEGTVVLRWVWIVIAAVVGFVLAAVSLKSTFWDENVWTFDDKAFDTIAAAFTAASTGAIAGFISHAVYKKQEARKRRRRGG